MSAHHTPDCAFTLSFGDFACDCDGPGDVPQQAPTEVVSGLSPTAREHLAVARAALQRRDR